MAAIFALSSFKLPFGDLWIHNRQTNVVEREHLRIPFAGLMTAETMSEPSSIQQQNEGNNVAQDPNECLEIMHAPSLSSSSYSSSSSSSSSASSWQFIFDPYHDRPISTRTTASRSIVHQNGLWHNSVHIWIVSPSLPTSSSTSTVSSSSLFDDERSTSLNAEILLQKRSSTKDTFPNRYDISCAGHVSSFTTHQGSPTNTIHGSEKHYDNDNYNSLLIDTLRAELSEELGWIDGVHVNVESELSKPAFIIPAKQSHLGGCNAFEHVYFLLRCRPHADADDNNGYMTMNSTQYDANHNHASTGVLRSVGRFSLGSAEVSEVVWRPVREVLDALRSGDESYAPRAREYVDAMEMELNRLLFGVCS